jgi:hypothetical protein
VGAVSDAALSLGDDAEPDSEVGASEGVASDLEAGALAGVALGVAAAFSGDAVGAFSDFSDAAGAFDGEVDEPEEEPFGGDAAGASAAKATAAEAMRRTTARARARAMVMRAVRAILLGSRTSGVHVVMRRRGAI